MPPRSAPPQGRHDAFAFDPGRYPAAPGCYLMRDAAGTVLYVGKAKHLRP